MFGPSLGGVILGQLGWRWIFFVNVPVGLLAICFAWFALPRDEVTNARRLDLVGFAMISPGLALLLQGLVSLGAWRGHGATQPDRQRRCCWPASSATHCGIRPPR